MSLNWQKILQLAKTGVFLSRKEVIKTDEEWRQFLTPEQYRVTRQKGTESPFSGQHCHSFKPGHYNCVCCGSFLFSATEKFDSGTGWPSFTLPARENAIAYKEDNSLGVPRMEVLCNSCKAHLGHVFPDGPPPTGLRYCINSIALVRDDKK